jgi:flagellar hook-associated protein 3 FlgL
MRFALVTRSLAGLTTEHAEAAERAASGQRITKPSDDPIAAAELVRIDARVQRIADQRQTARRVSGDLEVAEGSLASASELFARAHEIALAGANGSLSSAERALLANEVADLEKQLTSMANVKGSRGYLFGGSLTQTKPFSPSGVFSGNDLPQLVDLGAGATNVAASGARAFTAIGGRNVFSDLAALRAALTANDPAQTAATLDGLDASRAQIDAERGRVGLTLEKVRNAESVLEQGEIDWAAVRDRTGAADPLQAFSRMTALSQALERTVAVSRELLDLGSLWKR